MAENIDIRNKAKELFDKNEWAKAQLLYEQIYAPKCDKWLAWEYSKCLKKLDEIDKAIEVSKELFMRDRKFTYNNDLLAWLLYEKYFKIEKEDYDYEEVDNLYRITNIITRVLEQKQGSAYQAVIIKMIKILNKHVKNPYEKILELLEKLDVSILSEEAGKFNQRGREKEYRSNKEMYYSYKTKALLVCGRYEDCVLCCDEAFAIITDFHNDIDIWILSRKAMSLAKLKKNDDAIILFNDIIIKKDHYSLLESLADIYLTNNEFENALLFYCRAALTKDKPEMKVRLYHKIAKLLLDIGLTEISLKHVLFIMQIRVKNEWKIPNELQSLHDKLSIVNYEKEIKIFTLKEFWLSIVYERMQVYYGTVSKINTGGKTGFIKSNKGSYFFKISSIYEKSLIKENTKVKFVLIDSFNSTKQQLSEECAYIKFDKN